MDEPLYVTKPYLPDLSEFTQYLEQIWDSHILTNGGPFHEQLENELAAYLGVKHVSLFANGTLALMTALQTLRISGDVITTPFSFAATSHSLYWNQIRPVFCDIEPNTFTLDPNKIESCITANTTAIMPVHIYGYPCKIEQIREIAANNGLKVIYDAAHSFGVRYKGVSVLNFGDLSTLSFHATKIFTTFEGGAIISHDDITKKRIDILKNFGFSDEGNIVTPGMNAKMNEIQAAMGLLQLKNIDERIGRLQIIANSYRERLRGIEGLTFLEDADDIRHNYSYFPVLIDEDEFGTSRDKTFELLNEKNIFSRKYFYPLISEFPVYKNLPSANPYNLPIAMAISRKVLCLPNHALLAQHEIDRVCDALAAIHKAKRVSTLSLEA